MWVKTEQAMAAWLRADGTLTVQWFPGSISEYEALLEDAEGNRIADGNGNTVAEAIENCALNIEELPPVRRKGDRNPPAWSALVGGA